MTHVECFFFFFFSHLRVFLFPNVRRQTHNRAGTNPTEARRSESTTVADKNGGLFAKDNAISLAPVEINARGRFLRKRLFRSRFGLLARSHFALLRGNFAWAVNYEVEPPGRALQKKACTRKKGVATPRAPCFNGT